MSILLGVSVVSFSHLEGPLSEVIVIMLLKLIVVVFQAPSGIQ